MARLSRYLILPAHGLQAGSTAAATAARKALLSIADSGGANALAKRLAGVVKEASRIGAKLKSAAFTLVESLNEDGVKLVEATPEMISALRFEEPGLRAVPEVFYRPAVSRMRIERRAATAAAAAATQKKLVVTVTQGTTGAAVAGASVVAFTDFASKAGVDGRTSAAGKVTLRVSGASRYERLYVQHDLPGLWSALLRNVTTAGNITIQLELLDLAAVDSLRTFHDIGATLNAGQGVNVGVIDSGIDASHPDLRVSGGLGCVPESPENDFGPSGSHGTHVAGIIAGRGAAPGGVRGVAPGARLFSYRVFDDTQNSGSSFALVKAIRQGVKDKCDILNLSLGFDHDENTGLPNSDEAVREAISEAHAAGVVVVAAAGNDYRLPVSYPGNDDLAIAVSAVGRKGTFPAGSSESGDVSAPFGTDTKNYLAAFSNVGTSIDVAGAGVGVVSTVPGGHAPMSGTSMACPAVTGVLARLLSAAPVVLAMSRNASRADAIRELLFQRAASLGLGVEYEGKGLPR